MGITSPRPYHLQTTAPTDGLCLRGVELAWVLPTPGFLLPSGERLDNVIAAGLTTLRRENSNDLRLQRISFQWAYFAADAGPGRHQPPREAQDLAALCRHASGRAIAAGLTQPRVLHDDPSDQVLGAHLAVPDAGIVLLAALDLYLSGSRELLAWYLNTACDPLFCREHPDRERLTAPDRYAPPVLADLPTPQWHLDASAARPDPAPTGGTRRPGPRHTPGPGPPDTKG